MALTKISTDGVKDDAVTAGKIPANAVGSSELADNAVDTAAIADDAVTAAKIADSINSEIAANTAKTTNATHTGDVTGSTSLTIASDAVTTAKIADGNVTTAKIADEAVTLAKLPHGDGTSDGKFLRSNNGADPTFETVSIPAGVGGATGADFNDNVAIRFGGSNDGVIQYVSSTDALTISSADGADITLNSDDDLIFECDDDNVFYVGDTWQVRHGTSGSSESMIMANDDAGVILYYNGVSRLSTVSSGVDIVGSLGNIGVGTAVAILRDKRAHAVQGGTFTSGSDQVRVLNTEEHDGESFCSLNTSTGEFTLPAGTYLIYFEANAFDVMDHRTKIVTDGGTTYLFGNNTRSHTSYPATTISAGWGVVTNASSEGYFLKHRCLTTRASNGFGHDCNFGSEEEFYATVIIFRMD